MSISWNDFEDEVLVSWFVTRLCQPDYVIARSFFTSAVAILVTVSVILSFLSNTLHDMYLHRVTSINGMTPSTEAWVFIRTDHFPQYFEISLLHSFIVTGWLVICWRWLVVQSHKYNWRKHLCVEGFWTSNIVELIHVYDLKRDRQRCETSNSDMTWLSKLKRFPVRVFTKFRIQKLLYLLLIIQLAVVFFSKLCGLVSHVIVGRFVYYCCKHLRKKRDRIEVLKKYEKALKCLCMPSEDLSDLWTANEVSFKKSKLLMTNGRTKGESSTEINSLFCPYSSRWAEDGRNLLEKLQKVALPSVLQYFPSVEKQNVKVTIVSLLTIFFRLQQSESDVLTKLMKACGEVWDLLTFLDESDIDLQSNEVALLDDLNKDKNQVCMAADKEFYRLQMKCKKHQFNCAEERCVENVLQESESFLKRENLLRDSMDEVPANLSDFKDWMKIAPSYALYKLCKVMSDEGVEDFQVWIEESFRNVIAFSMSTLPDIFVNQCWKWAKEFEEDKLREAIHLAGKCRGMIETWGLQPQLTLTTIRIQIFKS